MFTTQTTSLELAAPEHLGLESRTEFRQAAVTLLEQLPERTGRLIIDLSGTRQVDSAGLGALMLVQRRASERRQVVVLRNANDELRFLLVLTKLDDLFQLEAAVSGYIGGWLTPARRRVLFVEDEPAIRLSYERYFCRPVRRFVRGNRCRSDLGWPRSSRLTLPYSICGFPTPTASS